MHPAHAAPTHPGNLCYCIRGNGWHTAHYLHHKSQDTAPGQWVAHGSVPLSLITSSYCIRVLPRTLLLLSQTKLHLRSPCLYNSEQCKVLGTALHDNDRRQLLMKQCSVRCSASCPRCYSCNHSWLCTGQTFPQQGRLSLLCHSHTSSSISGPTSTLSKDLHQDCALIQQPVQHCSWCWTQCFQEHFWRAR